MAINSMRAAVVMLSMWVLAACAVPSPVPTALPPAPVGTRAPTDTPQPTPTPLTRRTLPPSWTPNIPTPTIDFVPLAREATNVPARCDGFLPDIERSTAVIALGNTPVIYWTDLPTITRYRVRLYNPSGEIIFEADVIDNLYTFSENLFTQTEVYGWEVFPLSDQREQVCQPVGSTMVVTLTGS